MLRSVVRFHLAPQHSSGGGVAAYDRLAGNHARQQARLTLELLDCVGSSGSPWLTCPFRESHGRRVMDRHSEEVVSHWLRDAERYCDAGIRRR